MIGSMASQALVLYLVVWDRRVYRRTGKPTVGDNDARAEGYRLLGNGVRQVVGEEHLGLGGRLVGGLHVVEKEADVVPRPVRKLLREALVRVSLRSEQGESRAGGSYSSCMHFTTSWVNAGERAVTPLRSAILDMVDWRRIEARR